MWWHHLQTLRVGIRQLRCELGDQLFEGELAAKRLICVEAVEVHNMVLGLVLHLSVLLRLRVVVLEVHINAFDSHLLGTLQLNTIQATFAADFVNIFQFVQLAL